jgi:integrase
MNYIKVTAVDSLLQSNSPKIIESQLIEYIMSLRNDGIAYATIKYLLAPIFTFYQLNDVLLNKKKVFRYLGECKLVMKDKAYSNGQIALALRTADQRMRMIILLLASTGCRIGALPGLSLSLYI